MRTKLAMWALLGAAAAAAAPAAFAADFGVSVGFGQPGVYGRVDIGRFPRPEVVVQRPVIVERPALRSRRVVAQQPAYLWVPSAQQQQWSRYCGRYGACATPVYFVRDGWYRERGPGRGWRHDHDHDHDHDRNRNHDRGDGRGDRNPGWSRDPH